MEFFIGHKGGLEGKKVENCCFGELFKSVLLAG